MSAWAAWSDIWFGVGDHGEGPAAPGFYPVLQCWCVREGFFPGGSYWTGLGWRAPDGRRDTGISHWAPTRFEREADARDMAYRHDPEL